MNKELNKKESDALHDALRSDARLISASDSNELLCVARAVKLPEWATHVAVSKVRKNDAEPCAWLEKAKDYINEDPATLEMWAGSYKHAYWQFFSREELNT